MNIKKVIISIAVVTIVLLFGWQIKNLTTHTISDIEEDYTYTKTICNESNFCQGYIIKCHGDELIDMNPVSNAVMQYSEDWQDPRGEDISEEDYCKEN